jgi:hypothetical protein
VSGPSQIEKLVLDAAQEQQEANEQANAMEGESLLNYSQGKRSALDSDIENRTRSAGNTATRGMRGTAAAAASANVKQAYADNMNQVNLKRQQEQATSKNMITSAAARRKTREAEIALARKDWTDKQSKANPTVGTTPVNSGVTPIKATPIAAAKRKAATPAKKTYKGKRPGPG